ncbi:hypothetical protein WALSEDRAFT_53811 [Wallemia mellicola CBS 633.66]|uniref:SPIN90/Ldb17 leucine-rich domain-containing protein n=1 Tax=Wallemia mellicola (strain ATCC MYA-4683 / CBS 633.66) TaxID=671144 RepID=I4YGE2_WALMC|nr:hypothetical protein WALSEDRAFT_53811 [Wallemia mellicola CBS 633.66]EIM23034.1 hypothetical protein WALSEDRAFT_53811 [Wallemia mellicola CBS 633.66]|eukprot:XP_006957071.1 hypothetical protein WALSEDRAFT_53811 [Wallemia mellicola CBS 633.66]
MTADDEDFIVWEITDAHDFWNELSEYGHAPDDVTVLELDGRLKMFLRLCGQYHTRYLTDSLQFRTALELMVNSDLFRFHYVRMERVLIDFILITPDPHQLFVAYELLLRYGQSSDKFFKDCTSWRKLLPYWLDVIRNVQDGYFGEDDDGTGIAPIEIRLRYTVICLLYEISRAQKLSDEDLATFNSSFLDHLFDLVELTRDEADECFNYTIIKLLTSLNEQYMIRNLDSNSVRSQHLQISNNLVLNVLTRRLGTSKTFGENLIFILNRASDCREDICVKLLVLKILFLLFTTVGTENYFYTNDLKVLVDVFIRELADLPDEQEGLRHTYLRVLYPLLNKTVIKDADYKTLEVHSSLCALVNQTRLRDVSATTARLQLLRESTNAIELFNGVRSNDTQYGCSRKRLHDSEKRIASYTFYK